MAHFSLAGLRDLLPSLPQLPLSPSHDNDESTNDPMSFTDTEAAHAADAVEITDPVATLDPKPIDESKPKSNLDLINECDNFPYFQTQPELYLKHINTYFHLRVAAFPNHTLGFLLPSVAEVLRGLPDWELDDDARTLTLVGGSNADERSAIVAATASAMRATSHFKILAGWRNELYPVYGPGTGAEKALLFTIERAASALFGVVTYGVHMTAYTKSEAGEYKFWTPRRAATKQTYGGMLDNTVAGGMAAGEEPLECVVREAHEEASLPEELVRGKVRAAGTVTYFHIRDHRAGGETRLLQPECQYIYDLEVGADVEPKPCDDEVESFELLDLDQVREKLRAGEFKPNCAVVLVDFMVRHGLLAPTDEPDYVEIVSRLHRRLELPTR